MCLDQTKQHKTKRKKQKNENDKTNKRQTSNCRHLTGLKQVFPKCLKDQKLICMPFVILCFTQAKLKKTKKNVQHTV